MEQHNLYNFDIERIRETEFPNLKGVTYVDHAGATLYAQSQIEAYHKDLVGNLYGNPHSRSQSSRLSTDTVDQIRYRVLQFFHASPDEYSVIFTSGCTGALKLVAESFTFCDTQQEAASENKPSPVHTDDGGSGGCFFFLQDNHTSVQGMRELVSDKVSGIYCLDVDELFQELPSHLNQLQTSHDNQSQLESNPSSVPTEDISQRSQSTQRQNQFPNDQSTGIENDHGSQDSTPCHLFAYPAQSNYSGRKYPLQWIKDIQDGRMSFQERLTGRWFVVLDAASFVSSSKLDLQKYKPDFVTISFYKIFGFPTGLGALLVRNRGEPMLHKRYFGGGTVAVSNAKERFHVFRSSITDRFEDGTIPFLDIIALRHGMDVIHRISGNMDKVSQHTFTVAKFFHDQLVSLHHANGGPVAQVYSAGFSDISQQGAIVNFNIIRQDGQFVGFAEVDKLAQLHDVHLRTGCFCNIGACQKHLSLTSQQIRDNFDAGHVCGDDRDMIDGRPTGSVRISFGYMSTFEDARQCLKFIAGCFVEGVSEIPDFRPPVQPSDQPPVLESSLQEVPGSQNLSKPGKPHVSGNPVVKHDDHDRDVESGSLKQVEEEVLKKCSEQERYLTKICLYPVKSCAAFQVSEWEVGPRGLVYDREWMIVSESGVTLGQKREPRLCLLHPQIDLVSNTLTLSFPDTPCFTLSLTSSDDDVDSEGRLCTNKVCGDRVNTYDCGDAVSDWLSDVLDRPGTRLLRQKQKDGRTGKLKDTASQVAVSTEKTKLSLANESQFLLVSRESVCSLQKRMSDSDEQENKEDQGHSNVDIDNLTYRFRGNLIVGGGTSFEEEKWSEVVIGTETLISQGQCSRCQMVCMDQQTGERSREPLRTLVAWRGKKVPFGIHMRRKVPLVESDSTVTLRVGDLVLPARDT